jgi:hypothetical protein
MSALLHRILALLITVTTVYLATVDLLADDQISDSDPMPTREFNENVNSPAPVRFKRIVLTEEYLSDGIAVGDINQDGVLDIVSGPYWYAGPSFQDRTAFYPPEPLVPERSPSNSMFSFVHDFNGDGWPDILVLGRVHVHAAYWYENPGPDRLNDGLWRKHLVFERVRGESPMLVDLNGDGLPQLMTHGDGRWGWLQGDVRQPQRPWRFHPISEQSNPSEFYHGQGVGDLNNDGRPDIIINDGWFEQPAVADELWPFHKHRFSKGKGGAQMFVDDLNGDGNADVITAIDAHGWGLSWFQQQSSGEFIEHPIMTDRSEMARYGAAFTQPHALGYADIDNDGRRDIITGKRRWAHGPTGDIEPDAPPVVYWFQYTRNESGEIRFIPHIVDDRSGVGVQIQAVDVDGDGWTDILTASKLGSFLFLNLGAAER